MQMLKLIALAGLAALTGAQDEVCHSTAKVTTLEGQLAESRAEVATLKAALERSQADDDVISVTAIATQMSSILSNVLEEQLKKTELDDQVYAKLSQSYGSVSEFTKNVMGQVTAVDYQGHMDSLKIGEKYNTHCAPHVDQATKLAQPYMDEHVYPAWEKASAHVGPHYASIKDVASKHYNTLVTEHIPKLKTSASQVFDTVSGGTTAPFSLEATLNKVLAPVFDFIAAAAPKHAKSLPKHGVDRFVLLLVSLITLYVTLRLGWTCLKIGLKTTRVGTKITYWLAKFGLLFPIRIVLRILGLGLWFATGFYCCGLCRGKRSAASNKTAKKEEKGKKASLEEIVALLTEAQKKKKLDAAVKQACTLCKGEKPFSSPKNLEGKIVTQDVLKGALKKMGVDSKGLL